MARARWRSRSRRSGTVRLWTKGGHELLLDDAGLLVQLRHSNGSVITIDAAGNIALTANARVDVTAPMVDVHSPTTTFDGVVQCQTLIATASVVSPSYTPGVGNIW